MQIPAELRAALDACLEGVPRGPLMERAERISSLYRDKTGSAVAVRDSTDALAYAITRSPATYGAVRNALGHLRERNPTFSPATALDLGAGTGAASWAIIDVWPQITALTQADSNLPLSSLNRTLAQHSSCPALRQATQIKCDLTRLPELPSADLVLLSYMLAELAEAQAHAVLAKAWDSCSGALVIVEPGTPAGHQRILAARQFILHRAGRALAPCPHHLPCPLTPPDWCHFVQRIERSRDHRILKSADLPYEDEKFAYLIAVREPFFVPAEANRILARPEREKTSITVKLCKLDGTLGLITIPRRDKEQYKRARKREWGNEI